MLFLIKIIDILSISLSTNVDQTPQGFFWERGKTLFYYFLLMVQYPFTNPINFWKRMRPTPEVFRESGKTFFYYFLLMIQYPLIFREIMRLLNFCD